MKVSLNWLRDFVDINVTDAEYCDKMTHSGTKVEGWECMSDLIQNVVVGKILSIEKHPDADKLLVCMLDVGKETPVQIVTGAHNISVGDTVPVCLDGAKLPDGKVIKAGKLRGVVSSGMLCSIAELNLTTHDFPEAIEDGIFIMQGDYNIGQDIKEALLLNDTTVDFELTFNRPDCLGVIGIAKESAAALSLPYKGKEPQYTSNPAAGNINEYLTVDIKDSELCPRYTAAMVKNIKIAPSPLWMRMRLKAAGVRPINNIVDITNYVMLEYGQPMHAFDYSYIASKRIVVRKANDGEEITTLDGNVRKLSADMLCIADGEKSVALAGIMGGENSEINENTSTIVFESANFNRSNVRKTSRTLGLRTESAGKFEKGLPPYNTLPALKRALELVALLNAGDIVEGIIDVCNAKIDYTRIAFSAEKVNRLLGTDISAEDMAKLLKPLELIVDNNELIVPPTRTDIERTADIAEEIARLYGYNNIESTLFNGKIAEGRYTPEQKFAKNTLNAFAAFGFNEIYTYSFISPLFYDKIMLSESNPLRNSVKIINPLGEENSVMRTTALPSVLEVTAYNKNRKGGEIKLFELATVYRPNENGTADELKELVFVCSEYGDFYDIKGYCDAYLKQCGIKDAQYSASSADGFHPGRCASVTAGNECVGIIGQLHPVAAEQYGISKETYCGVISVSKLLEIEVKNKHFEKLPAFPSIERDLALIMDDTVEAGTVCKKIKEYCKANLESVTPFDVYKGKGIDNGKKSVAFRLVLRNPSKTMNDEEADTMVARILKKLLNDLGITLRQ